MAQIDSGREMDIVAGLIGLMMGAAAAWGLARRYTGREMGQLQAQLRARIDYWQDEAERAKANAARVGEQAAAWAAGCQQGREDVMSLARALTHRTARTD
ncbi:MAG TPA: hypothetical protein VMC83_00900 [Streptosporangiaceae bacterium]|nr:hypothetical protein [Streptosporangiaceae bacterium]